METYAALMGMYEYAVLRHLDVHVTNKPTYIQVHNIITTCTTSALRS